MRVVSSLAPALTVGLLASGYALPIHPTANRSAAPPPEGFRVEVGPTLWAVERVSRDGRTVWIRAMESGGTKLDHVDVIRTRRGFRFRVYNRVLVPTDARHGGTLPLLSARRRVALPTPLGHGRILGACTPSDATPRGRQCAIISGR